MLVLYRLRGKPGGVGTARILIGSRARFSFAVWVFELFFFFLFGLVRVLYV